MIKIEKTALDGVLVITPPVVYEDHRGTNTESYNEKIYKDSGIKTNFVLDSVSTSRKNVIRGIHGDSHTTKLISCLYGSFYFVVVNNDPESSQYRKWISLTISDKNRLQVLVPPKFGNAHLVVSDYGVFSYKLDQYYDISTQFTLPWNSPDLNIWWPIKNPILSQRDSLL
jgi:dTDP-4-dehydrorhamnose 3,5-epimerase